MMSMISNRGLGGGCQSQSGGKDEFITKEEVAARLKKTARTVENWQRRGYIPFVKIGKSVVYRWPDVVAHLQRNFGVCKLDR